jgi:hypothetical protein
MHGHLEGTSLYVYHRSEFFDVVVAAVLLLESMAHENVAYYQGSLIR